MKKRDVINDAIMCWPGDEVDQGQRYAVTYDPPIGGAQLFGCTEDMEFAERMVEAIKITPNIGNPRIIDRWKNN